MKKRITALLMAALLVAGSMPVTAADTGSNKTVNTSEKGVTSQEKNTSGETNGEKKKAQEITDKSNVKASEGSLNSKTKQKEADTKSAKKTNDRLDTKKSDTKKSNAGKLFNENESSKKKQENTTPIAVTALEELQKIGMEEGYPLDGVYELQNDIDAGLLTELPNTNEMTTAQPNAWGTTNQMDAQKTAEQTDIQKIIWKPIGTKDNPFTGEFRGNGHLILNLTISPTEGDAAFFGSLEGTIKDVAFINLKSISKTGNAALLAMTMNNAKVNNVLLNGNAELQNQDGTTYAAVNKKEAVNITARKADTTAAQSQIQSEQTGAERLKENIALEQKDCVYEQVSFIGELQGELPKGVSQIRTNPEYVSMMKGEKEKVTAPELPFELKFLSWELENEIESAEVKAAGLELSNTAAPETEITGKSAGKALVKAIYQYDDTSFSIDVPVVVGEAINEVEELKPVDDVFYGQLEVVAELIPIDGVFPKWMKEKAPDIIGDGNEKEKIQLHSWEDFKNIGNTEYNPEYTMDADYILMNDIVSDGLPFKPIGTKENPFTGSFQGQNFMIDVTLNPEINVNAEYKGLFGAVKTGIL